MTMAKNHPDYIKWIITVNDRAVERAILAIYARQTAEEKSTGETLSTNGVGFSGPDAGIGTYYAKWINSGRSLTGRHLVKARIMALKYTRQLCEIATERMAADAAFAAVEREAIQAE